MNKFGIIFIIIILILFYVFLQITSAFSQYKNPTHEQIDSIIDCNANYCKEKGLESRRIKVPEGYNYIKWDTFITCFDSDGKKITYYPQEGIYNACNIKLRKNPLRILSWRKEENVWKR